MPLSLACAVVRDNPPQVFIAEDQETLNWVLALELIARTPGHEPGSGLRDHPEFDHLAPLRNRPEVDVYPSFELYTTREVELVARELEFTPLFED